VGTQPNDPRTGEPSDDAFTVGDAAQVDLALRAVEMDTRCACGWGMPILDSDPPTECAGVTIVFEDDFENGANGWSVSNIGPFGPPTPYDCVQTSEPLPFSRSGVAWYCEDRDIGDCSEENESAVHSLISPPILIPADAEHPYASFWHYMESEPGWDGGQVSIRIDGSDWQIVPATAFEFNPQNSLIRSASGAAGTNPLAGHPGWTGVGGRWGRSVIRLGSMGTAGDTVEFKFDFGKNGCHGFLGWYLDDFRVYSCPDCNGNGLADHREFVLTAASGPLEGLSTLWPPTLILESPPRAASDVTLTIRAVADLGSESELIKVKINGAEVGRVFEFGAIDCSRTPMVETLVVPAYVFNGAIAYRDAAIRLVATPEVQASACGDNAFGSVFIEYETERPDEHENLIPDECEDCTPALAPSPSPDLVDMNRYLSLIPDNPGRLTALRITAVDLPPSLEHVEGTQLWLDAPMTYSEIAGRSDGTSPTFAVSRLSCEPVFLDWSGVGVVHVTDGMIVPGASYEVQAVDLACGVGAEEYYSGPLRLTTAGWGDITRDCSVSPCAASGDGVDFVDITAVVDKFRNLPTAPPKARTDLAPGTPDQKVDMIDVARVLGAFRGEAYPFTVTDPCQTAGSDALDHNLPGSDD